MQFFTKNQRSALSASSLPEAIQLQLPVTTESTPSIPQPLSSEESFVELRDRELFSAFSVLALNTKRATPQLELTASYTSANTKSLSKSACFQIHSLRSPILPIPVRANSLVWPQQCRSGAYAPTLHSVNPSGWCESKSACDELKVRVWEDDRKSDHSRMCSLPHACARVRAKIFAGETRWLGVCCGRPTLRCSKSEGPREGKSGYEESKRAVWVVE
jgi:hypothetical protein